VTQLADSEHFKNFAVTLEQHIAKYGKIEDWYEHQKKQVETLIELERKWRTTLVKTRFGAWSYRKFIQFIREDRQNILAARPFFRERQGVFAKKISRILKSGVAALAENQQVEVEPLYPFAINYQFILFVMGARHWSPRHRLTILTEKIRNLRQEIVEMNMPLAINRARVFYGRTPKSHLSYMDLIQISAEGLMSGVDKYSPDKNGVVSKLFRSTAIGRIGGNLIQEYSETLVHFFPTDKRKIYRGHKLVGRYPTAVDYEELAKDINDVVKKRKEEKAEEDGVDISGENLKDEIHETNASEIAGLMAAASVVSADSSIPTDPEAPEPITRFAAPEDCRPDVQVEMNEGMSRLLEASKSLTIFQRKLLSLKGIDVVDSLGAMSA
jgi:hypothetical protein